MARGDFPSAKQDQFMVRFPDGMRNGIAAAAKANGRSMNAEIVARLEQSFSGGPSGISDKQLQALKALAATAEWREAKFEIDLGHAIATLREVVELLRALIDSPEHHVQAVLAGRRVIESAATYLGRPYVYAQMKTSRFVDDAPPVDPLTEVIATGEWVTEQLLHEYRRIRDSHKEESAND